MTLVTCRYCSTPSSTTTRRRWRGTRKKEAVFTADPPRASDDRDDDKATASRIVIEEILSASTPMQTLGITTEEEEEEEEEETEAAKRRTRRRSKVRKAFSNRVKLIHPDVSDDERSAEATEKCVRAYAWLLKEEASTRDEEENTYNDIYASVFVNEILCVGASNCPSHSNCTVTAREYFRVNPKTKAARFERSETSNHPLAETYSVHLAVEQCPRRCVHWLDEKQTQACEEELQKAIDGLELIDDTALRLEYMISAFAAENRLIERELRAAENRRERNRGAADNASWWK